MHEFRRAGVFGLVWLAMGVGCAYAAGTEEKSSQAETVLIPLDQIWALDMPGTRDISKYDFSQDDPRLKGRISTELLRNTLRIKPPKQDALPAILLRQSDRTNLYQMLRVAGTTINEKDTMHRVRFQQIHDRFLLPPTDNRFSLFFYTHPSAYRVELAKVERRGLEIDIQYRFAPRFSAESSVHWALIPLGELPAGDYRVNITKLPMEQKFLDAGFYPVSEEETKRIVCQPADFYIRYAPEKKERVVQEEFTGETVVIPLDQIWALDMPGTRPMQRGQRDGGYVSAEGPLLDEIRQVLQRKWRTEGEVLPPGFAVLGSDMEAMHLAHATLTKNAPPKKTFPTESEISFVFFSISSVWYTHLHRVERMGNQINIHYRFVPHKSRMMTRHFALIPLGKLDAGNYQVDMVQSPLEQRFIDQGFKPWDLRISSKIVCSSFSFSVEEKK